MKKSIITCCVAMLLSMISTAQPFNLTVNSNTYQYLNNPISLNNGLTWDDPYFTIPLGFNFNYFGRQIDTALIAYGFGGTLIMSLTGNGIASFLSPFGADLIDRGYRFSSGPGSPGSLSPISYQLSGNQGNRIFKIEWKNAGFYSDLQVNGSSALDSINFQLWFYENGSFFEIHIGPNYIGSPTLSYDGYPGPDILLAPSVDLVNGVFSSNYYCLDGNPLSPALQSRNPNDTLLFVNGNIPNGTVYRFTPSVVGEDERQKSKPIVLYPNPTRGLLNIESKLTFRSIELFDLQGSLKMSLDPKQSIFNLSELSTGVYLIVLKAENSRYIEKIQIIED